MVMAAAPAAGAQEPRRAVAELLVLLDLGFLLAHLLGGAVEARQGSGGLGQTALASADATPFGLLAPAQLAMVALLAGIAAARERSATTGLAAMAAALLALGDLMALPARLAPVFASGLHPGSLGLSAILLGKLAAGLGLVLVACSLLLPGTTARDACSRRLVCVLLATILTLAVLDLFFELLSARWPSPRLDLVEEIVETLLTAWPLGVAAGSAGKLQSGTNQEPAVQPNRLASPPQACSGGCGN